MPPKVKGKPSKLKLLEGNPGKRPLPKDEYTPEPGSKPPRGMSSAEKSIWHYYARQLDAAGLLAQADRDNLANVCRKIARVNEISKILNHPDTQMLISYVEMAPNGTEKPVVKLNPLLPEQRHLMKDIRLMAPEFGMTPRGRVGLSVGGTSKEKPKMEGMID